MELYVARQPILDGQVKVVAYELLYRAGNDVSFGGGETRATAKVISASFYSPADARSCAASGLHQFPARITGRWRRDDTFPPEEVVIEILETVDASPDVVASCHALHVRGYRLALDDFVPVDRDDSLPGLVDYIKVDFRATTPAEQRYVVNRYGRTACLLAEKVETQEEFQQARSMGYSLFQGYFFAHPVIVSTPDVPVFKLNRLHVPQLQAPGMDFAAIEFLWVPEFLYVPAQSPLWVNQLEQLSLTAYRF